MSETKGSGPLDFEPSRFEAIGRLSKLRRRTIPIVLQMEATECGAASLAMVLGYYGQHRKLTEVRDALAVDILGLDALTIISGAERFGCRGRGIKIELEDLEHLPRGAILHWEFNHFLVFDRVTRNGVHLVDPAMGRRLVSKQRFSESFTGVAIIIEPAEGFEKVKRDRSHIRRFLGRMLLQPGLGRVLTSSFLLRVFALAVPLLTGLIVDRVVPDDDAHLLLVVGVGLAFVILFTLLTEFIRGHLLLQLRTDLDVKMTLGLLDRMVSLPYDFFQTRSMGDLLMRVNSNTTIRELLTANLLSSLLDGIFVITYMVILLLAAPTLAVLVGAMAIAQLVLFAWGRPRYQNLMQENVEAQARSQSYLFQMLGGIQTLKTCGAESRAVERWSHMFVDELNTTIRRGRVEVLVESALHTIEVGAPLMVLAVGAVRVMNGELSLGSMLALNALAIGFLRPLNTLVQSGLRLQLLGGYIERIDDVFSTEPEQDHEKVARPPVLHGRIELNEVFFRYNERMRWTLEGVSLTVNPDRAIALVGPSGSGKSTLAHLMLGLFQPTEGMISFDGHDIRELDLRWLRQHVGVVPQNPYVFSGSIYENITLTKPGASMDEVVEAAKLACVHDDVARLPMGYETILADGGATISGGQRQRIALARALIMRPAILLLDEATSELDTVTEGRIMRNLESMRCTRIIIAHRLSTVTNADEIVVMQKGQIVQHGHHRELVHQQGLYRDLVGAQSSGKLSSTA